MYGGHERVEGPADFEEAQYFSDELGQVFSVGETAVHIGNKLKFSQLLDGILTQTFAGEIAYAVITDTRGLLAPFIGPAILDRERDRARLLRGPAAFLTRRGFRCIVVQYRLPRARSDIQPTIRAAQFGERVAEAGGKKLGVLREPSAGDVAARNVGALAAVDVFLLAEFLIEFRWSEFL